MVGRISIASMEKNCNYRHLRGRRALVTCASRGLGFAVAKSLADAGADVVIFSRNESADLEKCADAIRSSSKRRIDAVVCDMGKRDEIESLCQEIAETGGVDTIVFNYPHPKSSSPLEAIDIDDLYHSFEEMHVASFLLLQSLLPDMVAKQWGRLIFLNSITAKEPSPEYLLSSSLRPGLLGLAKCLATTYAKDGIRTNSILLGYFDTPLVKSLIDQKSISTNESEKSILAAMKENVPVGNIGEPDGLGKFVVNLVDADLSYLNGVAISLDGGLLKGLL